MELKYSNIKNTYIIGDVHGKFNNLQNLLIKFVKSKSIVFQVGDFGIGFIGKFNGEYIDKDYYFERLTILNNTLKRNHIHLLVIRGNHDDPKYFQEQIFDFSNIVFLQDYSIVTINEEKYLCVGGALSIDKQLRIKEDGLYNSVTYWFNEEFVFDYEKTISFKGVNNIITHTAPNFCYPSTFDKNVIYFISKTPTLKDELLKERNDITLFYETIIKNNKIKNWYYGHFHDSKTEYIKDTKFVLLDELEIKEII